jgi:hypothetical protein
LSVQTSAANYLASYGVSGPNSGLAADFDFDGILNLVEYALGLNPNSASPAGLPVIAPQDYNGTRYLSMTFRRSSWRAISPTSCKAPAISRSGKTSLPAPREG